MLYACKDEQVLWNVTWKMFLNCEIFAFLEQKKKNKKKL